MNEKPMVLDGFIEVPYKWSTGPLVGRFLTELRDNKKIMGARCPSCGKVYTPPLDVCGPCFMELSELIEVGPEGVVTSYTVVKEPLHFRPKEPPYIIAAIRLKGADMDMIHFVHAPEEAMRIGMAVRAVFEEKREGKFLDIRHFE